MNTPKYYNKFVDILISCAEDATNDEFLNRKYCSTSVTVNGVADKHWAGLGTYEAYDKAMDIYNANVGNNTTKVTVKYAQTRNIK